MSVFSGLYQEQFKAGCLLLNVLTHMSVLCLQITHVLPCDAVYILKDAFKLVIFCKDISTMF